MIAGNNLTTVRQRTPLTTERISALLDCRPVTGTCRFNGDESNDGKQGMVRTDLDRIP